MGFIERTEKKFGKYAISGIGMKIVIFQCLIFLLLSTKPLAEIEKKISIINIPGTHFISDFLLLSGVPPVHPWRLFDYAVLFFASYILIMCCNGLESVWGRYKLNLFILTYLVIGTITLHIIRQVHGVGISTLAYYPAEICRLNLMSLMHVTLFITFAIHFPKVEILAFFILPVTFKFLAILESIAALYIIFNSPSIYIMAYFFGTIFLPPLLFHYKDFFQKKVQQARTKEFTQKMAKQDAQSFNKCKVCGKTEKDDPELEFRIADDGEEYCMEHLPDAKKN